MYINPCLYLFPVVAMRSKTDVSSDRERLSRDCSLPPSRAISDVSPQRHYHSSLASGPTLIISVYTRGLIASALRPRVRWMKVRRLNSYREAVLIATEFELGPVRLELGLKIS